MSSQPITPETEETTGSKFKKIELAALPKSGQLACIQEPGTHKDIIYVGPLKELSGFDRCIGDPHIYGSVGTWAGVEYVCADCYGTGCSNCTYARPSYIRSKFYVHDNGKKTGECVYSDPIKNV